MKRRRKLTRAAIAELKVQYEQLKQEADHAYKIWSNLSGDVRAVEAVLARNGVKVKKGEGESGPAKGKPTASTLRLAITDILKSEGKAIKASVIRAKLKKRRLTFRPAYFWRVLGRMEGKGAIKRVRPGMYELVNGAS